MPLAGRLAAMLAGAALALAAHAGPLPRVDRYDASRDASADIANALAAAPAAGRRVLVIVGGDWCRDCRDLDALFAAEPALAAARDEHYLPVKVYVGSDNRNEAALARFPKLAWVPTLFELDRDGRVARAVPSTAFHEGKALSRDKLRAFLEAPPQPGGAARWK